jgi:hypothetical protein
MRIPRRKHAGRLGKHPSTISALTQSVSIAVNGGAAQIFNATPSSPNCAIGASGTVCTFTVNATLGTDSFAVTTYTGTNGNGTALDRGVATVAIAAGTANDIAVSLGPVVSTTADSGEGSLRYAVGSASPGDTILFLLPSGSTIPLASPITLAQSIALAGPGAANLTISGGGAHQIFLIQGAVTISGMTLTQGAAVTAVPGGAILNAGTLTLVNDTIGNSTSTVSVKRAPRAHRAADIGRRHPHCTTTYYQGGGIFNTGTLTMSGTTFNANVVTSTIASCIEGQGGAIYNDTGGTISSTGDTFSANSAYEGGAVYNAGIGSVTFTNDTFSGNTGCNQYSGCVTSGCSGTTCTSFAQGFGGAIYDDGAGVVISASTFTNNVVGGASNASFGEGGALYLESGLPSITGSTFTGNQAGGGTLYKSAGAGGAIVTAVALTIAGDTFTNNVASGDAQGEGGAIAADTTVEGTGDTFTSNKAIGAGSASEANGNGTGGAVYDLGTASFTGSVFNGNAASGSDGGSGGAITAAELTLSGDSFTSNSATATGTSGAANVVALGGAVLGGSLVRISASTFTSNSVTTEGASQEEASGGALATETGTFSSSGDTYTSNTSTVTAGGTGIAAGGAMASMANEAEITGDKIASNSATSTDAAAGAGIYMIGALAMTNSVVSGNSATAPGAVGGGLGVGSASGEVASSTFTSNSANGTGPEGAGGAVYDDAGLVILNSTVSGNSATYTGGGVVAAVAENIEGSTISSNSVTNASATATGGGGVYATSPLSVTTSTISKNSVTVSGMGTSGGGGIFNRGGLTLEQSTVSGNAVLGSAPNSGGGGIFSDATSSIVDSTITGNSSSIDGGGIAYAANDAATIVNSTLYQNVASGLGGNIKNLFTVTLTNSIVSHGSAATGPDVDNAGTITSGDYNIFLPANVAGTAIAVATHDQAVDPLLLALADNGGPTFTNAEQALSPGIGKIPYAGGKCGSETLGTDQRGYTLGGTNGTCDVGAFAYYGVATSIRRHLARPHVSGKRGKSLLPHVHPIPFPKIAL